MTQKTMLAEKTNQHMLNATNKAIIELKILEDMITTGELDICNPTTESAHKATNFQRMFIMFVVEDLMKQFEDDDNYEED